LFLNRTRLRRGKWFIFDSLNDQSICFVSTGANNQGIMVDSIQQIMILGIREAQIMMLPDQIDLCIDRMSNIINLKVSYEIISRTTSFLLFFFQDEQTLPLHYEIPFHGNIKMIISIISSKHFISDE
jgi:hypothetical protein